MGSERRLALKGNLLQTKHHQNSKQFPEKGELDPNPEFSIPKQKIAKPLHTHYSKKN